MLLSIPRFMSAASCHFQDFMIGKHWLDFSFLSRYDTESDMEYFCAQASQEHDNFQNSKLEIILVLQTLPRDSFSLSVKKGLFNLKTSHSQRGVWK